MWFHSSMPLHTLLFIIGMPFPTLPFHPVKALSKYYFQAEAFPNHYSVVCAPTSSHTHFHLFFFFWPYLTAGGILVLQSGIEPILLVVEAQCLNHWSAREIPTLPSLHL